MQPVTELSDPQLVVAVGRFREEAVAEIYRRHGGVVFGLAKKVVGDVGEAEDIVQEVFLRLWHQPDRFDPARGTLRSFLLAQSHTRAVDVVVPPPGGRRRPLPASPDPSGGARSPGDGQRRLRPRAGGLGSDGDGSGGPS